MVKWSPKDPGDIRDYVFDWTSFLPDGETITDHTVTVADDLELVADDATDTTVTIRLSGGAVGTTYDVGCTITTTSGQIFDLTVKLKIAERILK